MGTRGAYGFRIEGQDKLSYNHWDSYPSGLGEKLIKELGRSKRAEETFSQWLTRLRTIAKTIVLVDNDTPPTAEEIKTLEKWTDLTVSEQTVDDWYCLLREAQGVLEPWIADNITVMFNGNGFMANSLFCEWAYVINLDTGMFETYKGFNKSPGGPGRYAELKREASWASETYYGVTLVHELPLSDLWTVDIEAWLKIVDPPEEEDTDFDDTHDNDITAEDEPLIVDLVAD